MFETFDLIFYPYDIDCLKSSGVYIYWDSKKFYCGQAKNVGARIGQQARRKNISNAIYCTMERFNRDCLYLYEDAVHTYLEAKKVEHSRDFRSVSWIVKFMKKRGIKKLTVKIQGQNPASQTFRKLTRTVKVEYKIDSKGEFSFRVK